MDKRKAIQRLTSTCQHLHAYTSTMPMLPTANSRASAHVGCKTQTSLLTMLVNRLDIIPDPSLVSGQAGPDHTKYGLGRAGQQHSISMNEPGPL